MTSHRSNSRLPRHLAVRGPAVALAVAAPVALAAVAATPAQAQDTAWTLEVLGAHYLPDEGTLSLVVVGECPAGERETLTFEGRGVDDADLSPRETTLFCGPEGTYNDRLEWEDAPESVWGEGKPLFWSAVIAGTDDPELEEFGTEIIF
ncbi:hypothetical protein ACTWP5_00090 [Streptomyces sp. 4N509B]|uniref:hypothetical protein n=1 Tax=Streptomyces sp. 4N509B TaxID=3457413 RepID=UPI003FD35CCE